MNDQDLTCRDGMELNLGVLFQLVRRQGKLLLLAAALGAILAATAVSVLVPTQYQSSVLFYVTNSGVDAEVSSSVSSGDLSTSRNLVDSYLVILKTREALLDVLRQAGVDIPYLELEDMITASAVNKTEFFRVTVTGRDPYQAEKIANAIGEVLPGKIGAIIEGTNAKVVEPAVAAWKPISVGCGRYALLGALGGGLLMLGLLLLRELSEGAVWNLEEVRRACSCCVLACLPDMGQKKDFSFNGEDPAYDGVYAKLRLSFAQPSGCRVLGVSAVEETEESGALAVNMARALARLGNHVLLVECNLSKPTLKDRLAMETTGGLSEFLAGQWEEATLISRDSVQKNLMLIPGGAIPPDPLELLGSTGMGRFLSRQREAYDYILLDLGSAKYAAVLGEALDGVLLTAHRRKTTVRDLKAAVGLLDAKKIRILGILAVGMKERKL